MNLGDARKRISGERLSGNASTRGKENQLQGNTTRQSGGSRLSGTRQGGSTQGRMGDAKGGLGKDSRLQGENQLQRRGGSQSRDGRPTMNVRREGPSGLNQGMADVRGRARSFKEFDGGDRFKHLNKGAVARDIQLDSQYKLRREGDVARRMDLAHLNKHGDFRGGNHERGGPIDRDFRDFRGIHGKHGGGFHGPVSPLYHKHHFQSHFRWPSYYSAFHVGVGPFDYWYYPHWSPWVSWSWHYRCDPYWDPRPIWCRPWIYVSTPAWVYWDVPAWEPMPVVASGTWVNVARVEVPATEYDLQLLAVRFVDPGHQEENLGPRYRVWFRNNSTVAIDRPFDVVLLAGNDDKAKPDLPMAGVRVNAIAAGETQVVDIRLPFAVQQMGRDAQGLPAPFSTLHVLVDGNREIDETSEVNNGTQLAADLVLPVDPSAFEVKPKEAAAGGELLLAGEGLGPEPGRVLVHLGGIEMEAEIIGWYDLGVSVKVPDLPLAGPVTAELIVIRADGAATNPVSVTVLPKAAVGQPVPEAVLPGPAAPGAVVPPAGVAPVLPQQPVVPQAEPSGPQL